MEPERDFYKELLDEIQDGIYFVDSQRRITYWNKGAERLTGFTQSEVLGKRCCDQILTHVDMLANCNCERDCPLTVAIANGFSRDQEAYLRHKDGHRVLASIRTKPLFSPTGNVIGAVEIFKDQSHQEAWAHRVKQLEELALLDPLTRLPNRRHSEATLKTRFQEMERYGWPFGVLFIDIDKFKEINDTHGHDAGDKALVLSSRTVLSSLRPFDFLGRWGGDEFLAIVTNVNKEQLLEIADRTRLLIGSALLSTDLGSINITVSIGAALAGRGDTAEGLVKRADQLMYQSKKAGRNKVSFVSE